jgi:hypothetical protein
VRDASGPPPTGHHPPPSEATHPRVSGPPLPDCLGMSWLETWRLVAFLGRSRLLVCLQPTPNRWAVVLGQAALVRPWSSRPDPRERVRVQALRATPAHAATASAVTLMDG